MNNKSDRKSFKTPLSTDFNTQMKNRLKGKRILIVEDNSVNINLLSSLMKYLGCIVDTSENGLIGLISFQNSQPGYYHAILMDISMPIMDGLTCCRCIRASARSDAKTLPIIAITTNNRSEDKKKSLLAGMNAHLSKPVDPQLLFQTLIHFLSIV